MKCSNCRTTMVKLWMISVVLPGDNADTAIRAWRYECPLCGERQIVPTTKLNGSQKARKAERGKAVNAALQDGKQ